MNLTIQDMQKVFDVISHYESKIDKNLEIPLKFQTNATNSTVARMMSRTYDAIVVYFLFQSTFMDATFPLFFVSMPKNKLSMNV